MTSWEEMVGSLRTELHHCHTRIEKLERELHTERRLRNEEKLHAIAVKNDKERFEKIMRMKFATYHTPVVPSGDEDGYFCHCGGEIVYPFEQRYCCDCGAQLDWSTAPQNDTDWARDMMREREVGWY